MEYNLPPVLPPVMDAKAVIAGAMGQLPQDYDSPGKAVVPMTILVRVIMHLQGEIRQEPGWSTRQFDGSLPDYHAEEMARYHAKQAQRYLGAA